MALAMTRRDSGAALRPVRNNSAEHVATPPTMTVVAGRRRYTWIAVTATMLMMVAMVGSVLLHTSAAERQLKIDELEQGVREYAGRFDELRAERAELRSPSRLASAAGELGMVPTIESEYVDVDPAVYAKLIAQSGIVPEGGTADGLGLSVDMDPLQQYELVKSAGAELP